MLSVLQYSVEFLQVIRGKNVGKYGTPTRCNNMNEAVSLTSEIASFILYT
jgi:hypothetical protein